MRRPTVIQFSLILLAGAACGFDDAEVGESPFPGARPLPEDFGEPLFPHISDADAEVYQKLNAKASVNFENLQLDEALRSISKANKLPIILDRIALEDAGLVVDSKVTLQINNVPIRSILNILLDKLELAIVVEDGVAKITTFVICNRKLETGIFPVTDLVTDDRKSWKILSRLIQIETDGLWEKLDGAGGTVSMSQSTKSLIVRQTPEVLWEIQGILTCLIAA